MITVIIPALNEANTIEKVVLFCKAHNYVDEVIVVDDNSEDETSVLAESAGATVIHSSVRGKGISMKEGIAAAKNELLIFLDGDIDPYPENTISLLANPLLTGEADFVKGCFSRNAGRVTELVAKPLLAIFYPGLSGFTQPLSGMIAGRKQLFGKLDFYNDYGVDIGILLDMYLMKAAIKEVNIGYIENKSKPWEGLGKMSREVAKAIISKAKQEERLGGVALDVASVEEIQQAMHQAIRENLYEDRKMVVFDVDDTVLAGRFIDACARKFDFFAKLSDLRFQEKDSLVLTKRIGLLLKGITMDALLDVIQGIKIVDDFADTVAKLKKKGYIIGLISNGYTLVSNYIKKKVDADFALAHQIEFFQGMVTGEINTPSSFFASANSICGHGFCKTNALQYVCEQYNVRMQNCIAVGDSEYDRCMVANAGKGVSFCSSDEILQKLAVKNINEKSFAALLEMT